MEDNYSKNYYSKKSLWKWILLYVVVGAVVYGFIYYYFFAKNGGYSYNPSQYQNNYGQYDQTSNVSPAIKSDQELTSASQNLDYTDVNQIDSGLSQNDVDTSAF